MGTGASLQESLRLQLEGRWERVEQARTHHAALIRRLAARNWRQRLRQQPQYLTAVCEQEPGLDEVLAYVERRAQWEHWPANHPGLTGLRALRSQRTRLEALARKRLATLTTDTEGSLQEVLGWLEALLRAPLPELPGADEPVLLEEAETSFAGSVCITPKRLLQVPRSGEPVQVTWASLQPGRISQRLGWVRVEGARTVVVPVGRRARSLVALLEVLRQMAQQREASSPVEQVFTGQAMLHSQHTGGVADAAWGVCVLRPGYVAFLPARGQVHLRSWLLNRSARDEHALLQLERVVEHLRQFPEDAFDASVKALAHTRGGHFWPAGSAELFGSWSQNKPGFRFVAEGRVLTVQSQVDRRELTASLLIRWPASRAPHLNPAVVHRWRRHWPALAGILLGLCLVGIAGRVSPWLTPLAALLPFLSAGAYAKGKGASPLYALLLLPALLLLVLLLVPLPLPVPVSLTSCWLVLLLIQEDLNTPPPLE